MADDPLLTLLEHLRTQAGTPVPTTALGRLRRTASLGARVGLGALTGRLRGGALNLGALSPEALAKLVESLGELKGVAMKVGQMLSYVDGSLDPQARRLLAVLQVTSQATPWAEVERIIQEDLPGEAPALLRGLERAPVATASIGQVHRGVLPDGTPVAVKVRHPGIDTAIRADFRTAAVGTLLAHTLAPGIEVAELMAEAQALFLEECDYRLEARRQERFTALYAGHELVRIPPVHAAWCGPRVLTTHWVEGAGLEAFLASGPSPEVRARAGRALYTFYVGSLYRHGLFNADPHPGNVLFAPDGRVTVLDHGCVREFEPDVVRALLELSEAVRRDDGPATQAALRHLGVAEPKVGFDTTRAMLRSFYEPLLVAGVHPIAADRAVALSQVTQLKHRVLRLRLPGKLLFLFRIRFGLYAVLARLGAEVDWAALEDELAARPEPATG